VALLERETGTRLLERRPAGVRLTEAGRLLVGHADAILARLRDAEEDLDDLLGLRAGKLRMSTLSSAAATIVPLAIIEFRQRLPEVELSVSMVEPPGVLAALRGGEVDLALGNDESCLELPDVDGHLLFEEPMRIALPRDHRLAGRRRIRLDELAEERWMLGTDRACPDASRFMRACNAEGFQPQIAFHHDDYAAILGCVAAGVGVAPIPDMVARSASSDVHICSLHGIKLTRPIVAVMPAGYQSRSARAMLDVLEQISQRWQAAGKSVTPLARTRAA
jgi:DNA-binding transcriptional LysR family regulator